MTLTKFEKSTDYNVSRVLSLITIEIYIATDLNKISSVYIKHSLF